MARYRCHFEKAQECLMIALNHYDKLMVPKMGYVHPSSDLCILNLLSDVYALS